VRGGWSDPAAYSIGFHIINDIILAENAILGNEKYDRLKSVQLSP
jgi:hypothetical protein